MDGEVQIEMEMAAEEKSGVSGKIISVLVILSFLLMIAVVAFQWLEIEEYGIQGHMKDRIKGLFSSNEETPSTELLPTTVVNVPDSTPASGDISDDVFADEGFAE